MLDYFDHDFSPFFFCLFKLFYKLTTKINGQKLLFFESHLFSEKNDILHLKIAHSVIILQSNKQNMWKWPILPLGLKGLMQ